MTTEEINKTASIQWDMSADVECPHCGHDNNFLNIDEYYFLCEPFTNNEDLKIDMYCEKCKEHFIITESIY